MQVDGTLGATAAISEMLVQSHEGFIRMLPALPDEWKNGTLRGVCVRGGFELDMKWAEGKITGLTVLSKAGERCRIRVGRPVKVVWLDTAVDTKDLGDGVIEFSTAAGRTYDINPK